MQRRTSVTRPLAVFFLLFAVFLTPAYASRDGSTDRPGLDYRTFELSAPNPDLCESACKREAQCRSWTYSWPGAKGPKAMCALKTGVPPKRSDTCCISGVMATSSPVTRTDDPKPQPPAAQPPAPSSTAKADPKPAPPPLPVPAPAPAPAPRAEEPEDRTTVVPKPKPPAPQQAQQEDTADEADTLPPAKVAACRDYANRALAQNAENRSLGCGLSGSRWGFSYDAYYNYCAGNPEAAWQSARNARDRELELCKTQLAARQEDDRPTIELPEVDVDLGDLFNRGVRDERFCRTFASQSVRQVAEARRLDCGFGGSRWSPSRVRQARLCEEIGPRAAAQLLNARSRQLDRCRAAAGGGGFAGDVNGCAGYAQESVRQARIARQLGCGYGGARWTTSYRAHLRWCQTAPRGEVMAELRIRERFLDRCE